MADEKQLTVAELLARNKKSQAAGKEATTSRRRRRSLDEGGVSVAELTGNVAKVKATPSESRHSNVSINDTAPVIPAPAEKQAPAAAKGDAAAERTQPKPQPEPASKQPVAQTEARPEPKAAAAKPKAQAATGSLKRVEKPSAPADKTSGSLKASAAAATAGSVGTASAVGGASKGASAATASKAGDDTTVIDRVADNSPSTEDTGELPAVRDDAVAVREDDAHDEEEKLSPLSIILLAVLGIVLGAVVFKGFEILWERFATVVVAILAIAVTAAMVGVVHAMRTHRDGFSMALAGIVGLVLTFGPLLLVL